MALNEPGVEELSNIQNLNIKNIQNIGNIDQLATNPKEDEVQMASFFRIPIKPKVRTDVDIEPSINVQQNDFAENIFRNGETDDLSSASVLADINDPDLTITGSINFNHIQAEDGIAKTITAIDNKLPPTIPALASSLELVRASVINMFL